MDPCPQGIHLRKISDLMGFLSTRCPCKGRSLGPWGILCWGQGLNHLRTLRGGAEVLHSMAFTQSLLLKSVMQLPKLAVQLYVLTAISVVIHNMSTSLSFIQHLIGNLVTPGDYTYPHFGVADHSFKCCDIHTEKRHTLISGYTHSDFTGNSLISRFSC